MKRAILLISAVMLLAGGQGTAEELIGVPVYPGAKLDADVTEHLEDSDCVEGAAYWTNDAAVQVREFFTTRGFTEVEAVRNRIRLTRGDIEVTIQAPPRKDPVTRKQADDTLITVIRKD